MKEQESLIQSTKEAASRVTSLNPSASFYVRDRNNSSSNGGAGGTARSGYMPMRSASMRETSYSRSIRRSRTRNNNVHNLSAANNVNNDSLSVTNDVVASNRSSVQNLAIEEAPDAAIAAAAAANGNGTAAAVTAEE